MTSATDNLPVDDSKAAPTATQPQADSMDQPSVERSDGDDAKLDPSSLQKQVDTPAQESKTPEQAHILIVEDEADAREIFSDLLTAEGYTVSTAVDGIEALAKLEADKGKVDLMLLDIIMPNKDGVETLDNVTKEPEKYGSPKVVMLTNIGGDAAVEKALQLGALGYLLKSETEPQQLLDAVAKYLRGEKPEENHIASI